MLFNLDSVVKAVCWDFDGVLMIPWTHPEEPFAQIRAILKYLHEHGILMAVTSFNPMAWIALEQAGLTQYLDAFRIGCNFVWAHHDHSQYNDAKHRIDLCKSRQMSSILENEWVKHNLQRQEVMLIDDDKENTTAATKAGFRALFVTDSFLGPNWRLIHRELAQVPTPSSSQLRFLTPDEHDPALLKASIALRFMSKIQEHTPNRVNDALTRLGAASKQLGTGAPTDAQQNTSNKRKWQPANQDPSVIDMQTILAATENSVKDFTQLHEKVHRVSSSYSVGGIEVLLKEITHSDRDLCAQSLALFANEKLEGDERTRASNLRSRFALKP